MKLKLSEILNAFQALNRLAADKMPIKLAYRIQRNIRMIQPELDAFEAARIKLIHDKWGEKQADGPSKVPPEKMADFMKEIDELKAEEVEVDIHPLKLDEAIQITPGDMLALHWMFVDPGPELD